MVSKLRENIGSTAYKLLGIGTYAKMISQLLIHMPAIMSRRSFTPLDKAMNVSDLKIRHRLGTFYINARHIDQATQEDNYAFGAVRELYIRDCYFRGHPDLQASEIKTVIDLGGNRGLFSTMCTPFCDKIVIVEAQTQYNDLIHYTLNITNKFTNYLLVNRFVGNSNKIDFGDQAYISFRNLLELSQIKTVDFLKIDIEGSEFSLFSEEIPLDRVRYISMEIHPQFGNVKGIISKLKDYHFIVSTVTAAFDPTSDPSKTDFLYARNTRL